MPSTARNPFDAFPIDKGFFKADDSAPASLGPRAAGRSLAAKVDGKVSQSQAAPPSMGSAVPRRGSRSSTISQTARTNMTWRVG